MKRVLLLLVTVLLGATVVKTAVTLCPEQNQTDYLNSELTADCAEALTQLRFVVPPRLNITVPTRDPLLFTEVFTDDLDIACKNSCQGNFSRWLKKECQDPYTARSVDAMCAPTLNSTYQIGERCRYGFPDALDGRAAFWRVFSWCKFTDPDECIYRPNVPRSGEPNFTDTSPCLAFEGVIQKFGCCYNSLYNDTDFLKYVTASGLFNPTMMQQIINVAMSPIWDQCLIEVPPSCEILSTSAAGPVVGSSMLCAFVIAVAMALAMDV